MSMLSDHLSERIVSSQSPVDGEFVVYWMRIAARGHENPALDVARELSEALDVPFFVYHAVDDRYPYASDRLHTFILEGARDVSAELEESGVAYALHVARSDHHPPALRELARRAAAVVTEYTALDPLREWTSKLAEIAPVFEVDTDCLVPLPLVDGEPSSASQFRKKTKAERQSRLETEWPACTPGRSELPDGLGFEPVDIGATSIDELVAACDIDHSVEPIRHTRGGSTAGYQRWNDFKDQALDRYKWDRNDPGKPDAVSRMSAYLHFGHVSVFRLARETAAHDGRGCWKFLDEMLVWREFARHLCHRLDDFESFDALPDWARESLEEHADDPREQILTRDELADARSGSRLWDACQRSLIRHGELHNNVRMTWGKALLQWTEHPREALELAFEFNDRFSLDGRDPNSRLGIMWCFGAFDRPYDDDREVIGKLRPRELDWHEGRVDMDAYEAWVDRPNKP